MQCMDRASLEQLLGQGLSLAEIGRRFFRLVLLNHGSRSDQTVIVLERHLDRLIQRNRHHAWLLRKRLCLGRRW